MSIVNNFVHDLLTLRGNPSEDGKLKKSIAAQGYSRPNIVLAGGASLFLTAFSSPVMAAANCGAPVGGGLIVCNQDTYEETGNNGIWYDSLDGNIIQGGGIDVVLDPTVANVSGVRLGSGPDPTYSGDLQIFWNTGTIVTGDSENIDLGGGNQGQFSYGILVDNYGQGLSLIDFNDGSVLTYGRTAHATYVWQRENNPNGAGRVTLGFNRSTAETYGQSSHGVYARMDTGQNDMTIDVRNSSITTHAFNSYGVFANKSELSTINSPGNIRVNVENTYIKTHGSRAAGISARNHATRGSAEITGSVRRLSTEGLEAHGIQAQVGAGDRDGSGNERFSEGTAKIALTGGTVEVSGDYSNALYSIGFGGSAEISQATGVTAIATGLGGDGIAAGARDSVAIAVSGAVHGGRKGSREILDGFGGKGAGIYAAAVDPYFPLDIAFTPNTNAVDIAIERGASVDALSDQAVFVGSGTATITNDGTITGTVTTSSGQDRFINNSPNSWNIRNFQATADPSVRDTENIAVSDFGAGTDMVTNGTSGTIRLLSVHDMTAFTADLTDDIAPVRWLTDGVAPYVPAAGNPAQPREALSIRMAGVEQAHLLNLESFRNAGLITMADAETGGAGPVAGDVFVITRSAIAGTSGGGTFVSDGGALHIDTVLNDGRLDLTDILVVDRAELGASATRLKVTNARPGIGASTDINRNAAFDTNEGILVIEALEPGSPVDAFRLGGSVIDGAWQYFLDQTDGRNWYLHSKLSQATGSYEAYPQALLALNGLPSLHQRAGDAYWRNRLWCDTRMGTGAFGMSGCPIWVRIEGLHSHQEAASTTTGASFDQNAWRLEAGADVMLYEGADGAHLFAGLSAHYGEASADVSSRFGGGSIDTTGYGLGATLTWIGANGFYVDGQARLTWFESDLSSDAIGQLKGGNDGMGHALSIEVGQRFAWRDDWMLMPQAQLIYNSVDFDDFHSMNGAKVAMRDSESIRLRLGLAADRERVWKDASGRKQRSALYAGAHLVHEFDGRSTIDVSGQRLKHTPDPWSGEIGLGFERSFDDDRYGFFGEVTAATSLRNLGNSGALTARVGMSIRF